MQSPETAFCKSRFCVPCRENFSHQIRILKLLQDDASLPVGTALGVLYSLLVTEKCLSEADPSVV